jgi:hypothetical protein
MKDKFKEYLNTFDYESISKIPLSNLLEKVFIDGYNKAIEDYGFDEIEPEVGDKY